MAIELCGVQFGSEIIRVVSKSNEREFDLKSKI